MRLLLHADASRHWEPAATVAARLARATEGSVTVLTAERIKRRQQEVLKRAEQVLGLPKPQVEFRIQPGLVEQVIPEVAEELRCDLLVLAPLGGLDWLTHGHILSRIVGHTTSSVLLARGGAVGFTKALVATEGPGHGHKNLDAALALASVFDIEVHLLHVLSQPAVYDYIQKQPETEFLDSEHEVATHLRELRRRVALAHVKGDAKVRVGPAQDEVLAEAWLVRHCPVSTLVVREPWPARSPPSPSPAPSSGASTVTASAAGAATAERRP